MKRATTAGELKKLLEDVPDELPILVSGLDHSYYEVCIRVGSALLEEGHTWTEDYGEATTPEAVYGTRLMALLVR